MADPAQNGPHTAADPAETCPIPMSKGSRCGRPILPYQQDQPHVCLMHTNDPCKDEAGFEEEFEHILNEAGDGVADFTKFVFLTVYYPGREFRARCVFSDATFTREVYFNEAKFTQLADFSRAQFTQGGEFCKVQFMEGADFGNTKFMQLAYFMEASFTHHANFSGAIFEEIAVFDRATFTEHADFPSAAFAQEVGFREVTFVQDARFNWTTFAKDANFEGATFTQNVDFRNGTFVQTAEFYQTTFTLAVLFQEAKFIGAVQFRETNFRQDEDLFPGPNFMLTEFSRPEMIVFYKTYLGQALFHNCDVSKFTFSSVEWRKRETRGKRTGKNMLFEEEVDLEAAPSLEPPNDTADERDFGLIAELYQQLKKNYDERKDYWAAGDFHYGEMEMKRLHSQSRTQSVRWLHRNLGLVAWYKYVSAYGESYLRPGALLLMALAIFALLFPLAGLDRNENPRNSGPVSAAKQAEPLDASRGLSYGRFNEFVRTYDGRKWVAPAAFFGHSLMTTISVAGFQKELKYEPSYPWGRALALLEVLLTSTLAALFLLALRRQFKR
jgi:uncharacterized protein YjbI with pentapeptide repeats